MRLVELSVMEQRYHAVKEVLSGAHVKAVQHHLGHSSATVTLNTYSHLFPDAVDRIVDGLESTYREAETA